MRQLPITLITGAGGALGSLIVAQLAAIGHPVIAGTRDPRKLIERLPCQIEVRRIDFDDPALLKSGLRNVERLLIISTDELTTSGRRQRQHAAALKAAIAARVSFIAYTSMPAPEDSPAIPFAHDHAAMERALQESGIRYATLRNSWYQENLLVYLPQIIADGRWVTAAGQGRLPYVARADAARVAAAVILGGEAGIHDIAGPEALTVEAIASLVESALGRPLRVLHADGEQVAAELARQGVSASVIPMVTRTEAHQQAGGFEIVSGDVERLSGRRPRPLSEFLHANAGGLLAHAR